jgi:RNA polymerase sigma-70 factor (ECF subfamily)
MTNEDEADIQAMDRLSHGDDAALTEIMNRWKVRLTAFLLRNLGEEAVALDLAEETFVRVYQGRLKYRPQGAFSNWLFGIALNLVRQHFRWKSRHPTISLDDKSDDREFGQVSMDPADPDENPSQHMEGRERSLAVSQAVAGLPHELREALILFEYEEMGQIEIASVIGCSPKAVERRIARAKDILREQLSKYLSS